MIDDFNIFDLNPHIIHCGYMNSANCPPPGTCYDIRRVKWYELELILWGEGFIITEGKKLNAQKGDLFLRKPGMVVQGISPYYCYLVVFDPFFNKKNINYEDSNFMNIDIQSENYQKPGDLSLLQTFARFPYTVNTIQYRDFEKLFSDLFNEFIYERSESPLFLKSYLLQILVMMHNEFASQVDLQNTCRSIRVNYKKVIEVKKMIDSNINLRYSLIDMANSVGLSPNFFCTIFKKIIGESPVTYMNHTKINQAKKQLIETDKKVKEIAYECGFENENYFYTLFKSLTGVSPIGFREKHSAIYDNHTV